MRILIIEEIVYLGKTFAPGRLIRSSTPEYFTKKYGSKVVIWENWPLPREEKKARRGRPRKEPIVNEEE